MSQYIRIVKDSNWFGVAKVSIVVFFQEVNVWFMGEIFGAL